MKKQHSFKDKKVKIQKREKFESEKIIEKVKNNTIIEKKKISSEISVIYPVEQSKF